MGKDAEANAKIRGKRLERDHTDEEKVKLADDNHVWLNAFSCINPTEAFASKVGFQVIAALEHSPMVDDFIGQMSVTYMRFNRS